jgi:hypothetical protein
MNKKITHYFLILFLGFIISCNEVKKEYHYNGNLKSKIPLDKEGDYHGKAKFYFSDGEIRKFVEYKHGYIERCEVYTENGDLLWESSYENNKRDGLYKEYYTNKKIKKKVWYKQGEIQKLIKFDTLNNIVLEYRKLKKEALPHFRESFIHLDGEIFTDTFTNISFKVPNIPKSQIIPYISNGIIKVTNRMKGDWKIKADSKEDSILIGTRIHINDSTWVNYGSIKYPVVK